MFVAAEGGKVNWFTTAPVYSRLTWCACVFCCRRPVSDVVCFPRNLKEAKHLTADHLRKTLIVWYGNVNQFTYFCCLFAKYLMWFVVHESLTGKNINIVWYGNVNFLLSCIRHSFLHPSFLPSLRLSIISSPFSTAFLHFILSLYFPTFPPPFPPPFPSLSSLLSFCLLSIHQLLYLVCLAWSLEGGRELCRLSLFNLMSRGNVWYFSENVNRLNFPPAYSLVTNALCSPWEEKGGWERFILS